MSIEIREKLLMLSGDLTFTFLKSGDIYSIEHKNIMINQLLSNPIDGSLNNIYLRIHRPSEIKSFPLLGIKANSELKLREHSIIWTGTVEGVSYEVTFHLSEKGVWFWEINAEGQYVEIDLIYGQDVGLAEHGAIRTNEAYVSQYIDHAVFKDEQLGYVVCSRQNQPQQGLFPYLQQGALTKTNGYSTDGFQFFGLSYKETNEPMILKEACLTNKVYQYEFAYTGLQTERVRLNGKSQFVFYGMVKDDHTAAVTSLEFKEEIEHAWKSVQANEEKAERQVDKVMLSDDIGLPLKTLAMTKEEIESYFPNRIQEEWDGDKQLSFFTPSHEHVVLKEKELLVERPHGHILMTGQNHQINEETLSTTSHIFGVFNSQLVVGNTSFNKMMTNIRNALNVTKTSGQRIYIEMDGKYHLLTVPSMFELGFNYARWYYKTTDDTIIVTNYTILDSADVHLHCTSTSGKVYRFLVTNQISMNNNEFDVPFHLEVEQNSVTFSADEASDSASVYQNLKYRMTWNNVEMDVSDESRLASNVEKGSAGLVVLETEKTSDWTLTIQGLIHGEDRPVIEREWEKEVERYRKYYREVMNGFELNGTNMQEELMKVNSLAWWYTHNMLVHYSVPHGLEQYGGAAWGTRDVCQGPTEYFMATHKYEVVKDILKTVYSHQYVEDGNWPQWFMFDKYFTIQQEESHGDIIVWPLKVLSDYLKATNDFSILEERVPYTKKGSHQFTNGKDTILTHLKKEVQYMKDHFLHDTFLSSYGDGDWDDTLQPANAQLKTFMSSSWTVALTYQALNNLANVLDGTYEQEACELKELVKGIEGDYRKYILNTDVLPGFVYIEDPSRSEFMVHPTDKKTGIQYRLLPMTRSMISELLTKEQAESHYRLIKEKLYCSDGVRLMNRPANYRGGVSTHFKRAEQASNFGREIGLQYVHAHIRYVEAMAKLGKVDEVWSGLEMINPIGIQAVVPNAERRQSNAYFSSSDGKFNTRYEAQENFEQLKNGKVQVKGGWRIYSSGPGIYMNQLISNCLGIRQESGDLVLDPVLEERFDGLKFTFTYMNKQVIFVYRFSQGDQKVMVNGETVNYEETPNRYRKGGMRISRSDLLPLLQEGNNTITIYL